MSINPGFKKSPFKKYTIEECRDGIIQKSPAILSYLISKSESTLKEDEAFLLEVIKDLPVNNSTKVIAISGSPGVGKSTFINSIGQYYSKKGHSIAILPVDPSSSISKGSILGDKTRMEDIVNASNVYIKPMPSSNALGGVAEASQMAKHICVLAGFDYVFIESVGVGQSEYEAKHLCQMFILLLQPGGGDDLQGIKRGIMEMADLLIINKNDGSLQPSAQQAYDDHQRSLKLMLPNAYGWKTKVCKYSSIEQTGIMDVDAQINNYFDFMQSGGKLEQMEMDQNKRYFNSKFKDVILEKLELKEHYRNIVDEIKEKLNQEQWHAFEALDYLRKKL